MQSTDPRSITAPELQRWLDGDGLSPRLVDVREDSEVQIAPFPGDVLHLPLSRSSDWMETVLSQLTDDRAVVVLWRLCTVGKVRLQQGSTLVVLCCSLA